ncbi:MAG: ATP-binding cassette domain-containing protein [Methylococcales bacterium]
MAERCHTAHSLRQLPELGARLIRLCFELALTALGLIWLDPAGAPLVLIAAGLAVAIPLSGQPLLNERDLRLRTHSGALSRFYLDALLAIIPVRVHGAESALRREPEGLLLEWTRAGLRLQQAAVLIEGLQSLLGYGLAAWILSAHLSRHGATGSLLLLVYWALNLPVLGEEIALIVRQYPLHRNTTLRLLEPLGAPEYEAPKNTGGARELPPGIHKPQGHSEVGVGFQNLGVNAGGHSILNDIDLTVQAGCHVAVVGLSGAGKSTLVGLLLGWRRPSAGQLWVEGVPLDHYGLQRLRGETAWVDPAVQLWNRSLLDNLVYGMADPDSLPIGLAIETADLCDLLETCPQGLQTVLGEGGGLVSGGEGQRLRFGRAIARTEPRLVILDEPFRGLDRDRRARLLERPRQLWRRSTLFCITHDLRETLGFDEVVVIEGGRIIEKGSPVDPGFQRLASAWSHRTPVS